MGRNPTSTVIHDQSAESLEELQTSRSLEVKDAAAADHLDTSGCRNSSDDLSVLLMVSGLPQKCFLSAFISDLHLSLSLDSLSSIKPGPMRDVCPWSSR